MDCIYIEDGTRFAWIPRSEGARLSIDHVEYDLTVRDIKRLILFLQAELLEVGGE